MYYSINERKNFKKHLLSFKLENPLSENFIYVLFTKLYDSSALRVGTKIDKSC